MSRRRWLLLPLLLAAACTTPPVGAPPVSAPPGGRIVHPEDFGAVEGEDATDALNEALDSLAPGDTLELPAGRTYRHRDLVHLLRPGARLTGPGRLLATVEQRSGVWVEADDVTLTGGLVLAVEHTTRRWDEWEKAKLRLAGHRGTRVEGITIEGSASAGIMVSEGDDGTGAHDFAILDVTVRDTRADGIHMMGGSNHGIVVRPHIVNSGDDGVSVVSYGQDPAATHHITVESPLVEGTTWGRGVSVVGGEDITYRDVTVRHTSAAGIYVAVEQAYGTMATRRVRIEGGRVEDGNWNEADDHGAVLVNSERDGIPVEDVAIEDLDISGTRPGASWHVAVLGPGPVAGVRLDRFTVTGPPATVLFNAVGGAVTATGWTVDGTPVS
jgi:hypothetical protein